MGFDKEIAIEAYLVSDRNKEQAINYILESKYAATRSKLLTMLSLSLDFDDVKTNTLPVFDLSIKKPQTKTSLITSRKSLPTTGINSQSLFYSFKSTHPCTTAPYFLMLNMNYRLLLYTYNKCTNNV